MIRAFKISLCQLLLCGAMARGGEIGLDVRAALQRESGGYSLLEERTGSGHQAMQVAPLLHGSWRRPSWSSEMWLVPAVDIPTRRRGSELSSLTGSWKMRFVPHWRISLEARLRSSKVEYEEDTAWRDRSRLTGELLGRFAVSGAFHLYAGYAHARTRYSPSSRFFPEERAAKEATPPEGDRGSRGEGRRDPPDWAQGPDKKRDAEERAESPKPFDPVEKATLPDAETLSAAGDSVLRAALRRDRRHALRAGLMWNTAPLWATGQIEFARNASSVAAYSYEGMQLEVAGGAERGAWELDLQLGSEWRRYGRRERRTVWRFSRIAGGIERHINSWLGAFIDTHREYGFRRGDRAFTPWTFVSVGLKVNLDLARGARQAVPEVLPLKPCRTPRGWLFRFASADAKEVHLIGTFSDWRPQGYALRRVAGEMWEITVALEPGVYEYAFLVDGEKWISPPEAPMYADDGFGNDNGVLVVEAGNEVQGDSPKEGI